MLFSLGSLLVIAIIVQMIYATVIRPRAGRSCWPQSTRW